MMLVCILPHCNNRSVICIESLLLLHIPTPLVVHRIQIHSGTAPGRTDAIFSVVSLIREVWENTTHSGMRAPTTHVSPPSAHLPILLRAPLEHNFAHVMDEAYNLKPVRVAGPAYTHLQSETCEEYWKDPEIWNLKKYTKLQDISRRVKNAKQCCK